jgi:hypothetical protein
MYEIDIPSKQINNELARLVYDIERCNNPSGSKKMLHHLILCTL